MECINHQPKFKKLLDLSLGAREGKGWSGGEGRSQPPNIGYLIWCRAVNCMVAWRNYLATFDSQLLTTLFHTVIRSKNVKRLRRFTFFD